MSSSANKVESLVREDAAEKGFTVTRKILNRNWEGIVEEISIGDSDLTEFLLKKDLSLSPGSYSNNEAVLVTLLENGGDEFGPHLCYMALRESLASRGAGAVCRLLEIIRKMEDEATAESHHLSHHSNGTSAGGVNNIPPITVLRIELQEGPAQVLPTTGSQSGMPQNKIFVFPENRLQPPPTTKQPVVNPPDKQPHYQVEVPPDSIPVDSPRLCPTSSPIPGDTDSNLSFPYSPGRQASN